MSNSDERILITGANGFIGKNIIHQLSVTGKEVVPFAHTDGDIRILELGTLSSSDQIIHLANRNFIPDSWKYPGDFFSVNVDGTRNILEQCRINGTRLIYVSAYVYGQPEYLPINEKHPVKGLNPYMKSKLLTEELVRFYGENFEVPYTIIRPFNIYGAEQNENFLIPTIARQVADTNIDTIIVQDLSPKRDFLHINDFTHALIEIIDNPDLNDTFNIGYGKSYSVEDIIKTFLNISGRSLDYLANDESRINEVPDVVCDNSKMTSRTNWTPSTSLRDGLTLVLESLSNEM